MFQPGAATAYVVVTAGIYEVQVPGTISDGATADICGFVLPGRIRQRG